MTRSSAVRWIAAGLLATAASGPVASQLPQAHRRLVICFDGTDNNAEQEVEEKGGHKVYKPSNVLKTLRAVLPVARDGTGQLTFYTEGVGGFVGEPDLFSRELVFLDRVNGGAFASGFEGSIKSAYRFLVSNYNKDDEIFIFGFSRGGAQAQSLVRFIDFVGGLLQKDDEYWLIALFDSYRKSLPPESRTAAQVFQCIRHPESCAKEKPSKEKAATKQPFPKECKPENLPRRDGCTKDDHARTQKREAIHDARPVQIRFLGVWDTVLATGGRIASDFSKQNVPTVSPKYDFHIGRDGKPPAIVATVRQALAIDERRWDFRPQIWRWPADAHQSLKQLWFPGVHSNIGGGFYLDGLANTALEWMIGEAREAGLDVGKAGLDVDCDYLNFYAPCVLGTRCDSDKGFWAVQEFLRGKSGRGVRDLTNGNHVDSAGIAVHESAVYLMVVDPTYRPVNLLTFLAQGEGRIPRLPDPAQQTKLQQIVEDFKRQSHGQAARAGRRSLERCPS